MFSRQFALAGIGVLAESKIKQGTFRRYTLLDKLTIILAAATTTHTLYAHFTNSFDWVR